MAEVIKELTVKELYNLENTIAAPLLEQVTYPWEALPLISDFILKLGPTLDPEIYEEKEPGLWVAKTATIAPTAYVHGPAIICPGAKVNHCAYVRTNAIIGAGATVGNSSELKNVILFDGVEVPHYNYVGDSILGKKAHMGAGSITSNLKSDKKNIQVNFNGEKIPTGLRKFGAMLGDGVEIGCGSILNPGSVVGAGSRVYPLSNVRGYVPAHSIYKKAGEVAEILDNI